MRCVRRRAFGWSALVCIVLAAVLTGCRTGQLGAPAPAPRPQAETFSAASTRRMAEMLQSIARATDARDVKVVLNVERARMLKAALERARGTYGEADVRLQYAIELL